MMSAMVMSPSWLTMMKSEFDSASSRLRSRLPSITTAVRCMTVPNISSSHTLWVQDLGQTITTRSTTPRSFMYSTAHSAALVLPLLCTTTPLTTKLW